MSFGRNTYGGVPFGDSASAGTSATLVVSFSFAATSDARVYVGTREEFLGSDDSPPLQPIEGTLDNIRFRRSIMAGGALFGPVLDGQGEISITNVDARYDIFPQQYAIDGRPLVARLGAASARYIDRAVILSGTVSDFSIDDEVMRVSAEDKGYRLTIPLQTSLYGGTGGADGGEDLANKRKPCAFGYVRNAQCPMVKTSHLILQANDGPVQDIPMVYDRGIALVQGADFPDYAALQAVSTVGLDGYLTCLAEGFFRLCDEPDGTVTADIDGDKTGGTFVTSTADIIRRILTLASDLDADEIYEPSFTAFAAVQSAPIGFWADHNENLSIADVLARLLRGVTGWWGFNRIGKFGIWVFTAPEAPPHFRFLDDLEAISTRRERPPSALSPVPWRFRIGYARNETVQSDLSAGVSAERRGFSTEQYRVVKSDPDAGAVILSNHPFAQDPEPIESYFLNQSDAQAECDRLLTLFGASRSLYRVTLGLVPYAINVGDVVGLRRPRHDLAVERMMRVVEITEESKTYQTEILAYG